MTANVIPVHVGLALDHVNLVYVVSVVSVVVSVAAGGSRAPSLSRSPPDLS